MGAKSSRSTGSRRNRNINVDITPLIDVLFMLIIFFVLTTAFVQGSADVDLPDGDPGPVSSNNPILVTVTADSRIFWAGAIVTPNDIPRLARAAIIASDDILIAGDKEAPYGDVASILEILRSLGLESVGLAFGGGL